MVQREKSVSASLVVPITLGFKHKLEEISATYNNMMIASLKASVEKQPDHYILDDKFILSAILDPSMKLRWCKSPEEMEEKLLYHARKLRTNKTSIQTSDTEDSPPREKTKHADSQLHLYDAKEKTKRGYIRR